MVHRKRLMDWVSRHELGFNKAKRAKVREGRWEGNSEQN